jgi:lysozyme family protein
MAALSKGLAKEYSLLYESCLIRPNRKAAVGQVVRRLTANRPRYEKVAKALKMPWYVVAVIHNMEAGGDFKRHLHNGDPLSARTTHVPAGRPKAGKPPFTWEASAIDALTGQGLGTWKDWSIPGALYKLEGYNGWGYRDHHPTVKSPYLWSFSNHYTKGKYVADGRFSPTAVSQQVGAAVLLKQLADSRKAAVEAGPRVLQLANPHVTGADVKEAQRLLMKNPFGSFDPGGVDGEYGDLTAGAVARAKWELGFPQNAYNSVFGPQLEAILSGKKPLPAAFSSDARSGSGQRAPSRRCARRSSTGPSGAARTAAGSATRRAGPGWARSERPARCRSPRTVPPLQRSATAGPAPRTRTAPASTMAYTGSMLDRCRRIPRSAAKPGDLVVWTPPSRGQHVCVVVAAGPDPMLVSHGSDSGPKRLRFSAEDAYQRRHGHGNAVWLSAF